MKYTSVQDAVEQNSRYRDLTPDLQHAFQRQRVAAPAQFVRQGDAVLDIGCNAGYFITFCPQAAEVHGVDVNPALVALAAMQLTTAQVARAEALPFPDRAFDVVNVSGVLEQVYDPALVLREAARVTRRALVGNTTHEAGQWGTHRTATHPWQSYSYSEAWLRRLLEPYGRVTYLSTLDLDGRPQCWLFEVQVSV